MSISSKYFNMAQRAVSSAFDQAGRVLGQPQDPDLAIYERLTPNDFPEIMKKYGEQKTLDYIRNMEARRMQIKGG